MLNTNDAAPQTFSFLRLFVKMGFSLLWECLGFVLFVQMMRTRFFTELFSNDYREVTSGYNPLIGLAFGLVTILIVGNTILRELCCFQNVRTFCKKTGTFINGYVILFYVCFIPLAIYVINGCSVWKSYSRLLGWMFIDWTFVGSMGIYLSMGICALLGSIILLIAYLIKNFIACPKCRSLTITFVRILLRYEKNSIKEIILQMILNIFRWPVVVYLFASLLASGFLSYGFLYPPRRIPNSNVAFPAAGMIEDALHHLFFIALFCAMFAAVMHGIFRVIEWFFLKQIKPQPSEPSQ